MIYTICKGYVVGCLDIPSYVMSYVHQMLELATSSEVHVHASIRWSVWRKGEACIGAELVGYLL